MGSFPKSFFSILCERCYCQCWYQFNGIVACLRNKLGYRAVHFGVWILSVGCFVFVVSSKFQIYDGYIQWEGDKMLVDLLTPKCSLCI